MRIGGALVERADHVLGIEDLDVGAGLDVLGADRAAAFLLEHHALHAFGVNAQRDFLDVEDDVGHILTHAGDRRELVQHAVDLHGLDGGALQRRQQHAAQRVAERHAEAALERLGDDGRDAAAIAAGSDVELVGLDQVLPVLLQNVHHGEPRLASAPASRVRRRMGYGSRSAAKLRNADGAGDASPRRSSLRRGGACAAGSRCAGWASRRGSR